MTCTAADRKTYLRTAAEWPALLQTEKPTWGQQQDDLHRCRQKNLPEDSSRMTCTAADRKTYLRTAAGWPALPQTGKPTWGQQQNDLHCCRQKFLPEDSSWWPAPLQTGKPTWRQQQDDLQHHQLLARDAQLGEAQDDPGDALHDGTHLPVQLVHAEQLATGLPHVLLHQHHVVLVHFRKARWVGRGLGRGGGWRVRGLLVDGAVRGHDEKQQLMPLAGEDSGLKVYGDLAEEGLLLHPLHQLEDDVIAHLAERLRHAAALWPLQLFHLVVLSDGGQGVLAHEFCHQGRRRDRLARCRGQTWHALVQWWDCSPLPCDLAVCIIHATGGWRFLQRGFAHTVSVRITRAVCLLPGQIEATQGGVSVRGGRVGVGGQMAVEDGVGLMGAKGGVAEAWREVAGLHGDGPLGALPTWLVCGRPPLVLLVLHLHRQSGRSTSVLWLGLPQCYGWVYLSAMAGPTSVLWLGMGLPQFYDWVYLSAMAGHGSTSMLWLGMGLPQC